MPARPAIEAIIFDFGGVITTSPFEAFNRLEDQRGLPRDFVRRINAADPDRNAWARFERAEIDAATFDTLFAAEAAAQGHALGGAAVLGVLGGAVRPAMVAALDRLTGAGYRIACITNTVPVGHGAGMARSPANGGAGHAADPIEAIFARFEHVVESSRVGLRKPDPRIYRLMCDLLGLPPVVCVYLDDLGINCKPAPQWACTLSK